MGDLRYMGIHFSAADDLVVRVMVGGSGCINDLNINLFNTCSAITSPR